MDKSNGSRGGTQLDVRQTPPRAVDLRRPRQPEIEIVSTPAYDFLLSLHVAVASPERDYTDYDIGRTWIESARARCAAQDGVALDMLERYFGSTHPGALHSTVISLVALAPEPHDIPAFLGWLAEMPVAQFFETLLDQEGLGDTWRDALTAALAESATVTPDGPGAALPQLLAHYPAETQPVVADILRDPAATRSELVAALHTWNDAVFAAELERVVPLLRREAAKLERLRAEMPTDRFIKYAMSGVEWERPAGFRRIIFAPSYFSRPAVYYHFWHGTLTFCLPIEATILEEERRKHDPIAPSEEILRFFEALGDSTRLRILRLLCDREMYLTELATALGLTKATTKHHMVRLRAAGFVTLYDRDRMTYYALRPDISRRAARFIDEYLPIRPQSFSPRA